MITAWTRNLKDQDEVEKFQQAVKNSVVLDRLHELLDEMKKEQERDEVSISNYYTPGWDYQQAHRNGYVSCLMQIMKLTNPDQRKK